MAAERQHGGGKRGGVPLCGIKKGLAKLESLEWIGRVRADSGFFAEELLKYLEELKLSYIHGCVKGSYQEAGYEIKIDVLGRLAPFQVIFEHRTGKYCLFGAAGKPSEPDDLGETLIGEFLGK